MQKILYPAQASAQMPGRFARVKGTEILLFLLLMGLLSACQTANPAEANRYQLIGEIKAINLERHRLTVAHKEIQGYMEAMTMDYAINKNLDLKIFKTGDKVRATLLVKGDESWLEEVAVSQQSDEAAQPKIAESIAEPNLPRQSKKVSSAPTTRTAQMPKANKMPSTLDHSPKGHAAHSH